MCEELEKYEASLLNGISKARQIAEHNNNGKLLPEYLLAALLSEEQKEKVDPVVAEHLELNLKKSITFLSHNPTCICDVCTEASISVPTKDSHGNRLAAAMPFN